MGVAARASTQRPAAAANGHGEAVTRPLLGARRAAASVVHFGVRAVNMGPARRRRRGRFGGRVHALGSGPRIAKSVAPRKKGGRGGRVAWGARSAGHSSSVPGGASAKHSPHPRRAIFSRLGMLTKSFLRSRLETRAKESSLHASTWAETPGAQ